jgi:hypothetical protein
MRLPAFLALALVVSVPTAVAARSGGISGSWQATIANAPNAQFDGVWKLTFGAKGNYAIAENGRVLIRGKATYAGASVTFHDRSGVAACSGAQATGLYAWAKSGTTLRFVVTKDACTGRQFVLSRRFKKT